MHKLARTSPFYEDVFDVLFRWTIKKIRMKFSTNLLKRGMDRWRAALKLNKLPTGVLSGLTTMRGHRSSYYGLAFVALAGLTGCMTPAPVAHVQVADYMHTGQVRRYQESFEECFYDIDSAGNVQLVMRRGGSSDPLTNSDYNVVQIVHVQGIWHSIPGRNPTHRTQINGTVNYAVTGHGIGGTFEGAGAVHFTENASRTQMKGTLDHAIVLPKRSLSASEPMFDRAEISGEFKAQRDPRKVARISNDVNRLFGPLANARARAPADPAAPANP